MKHKRNLKNWIFRGLRKVGWLCKKSVNTKNRIRISKTINPDGSVVNYDKIYEQPINTGNTFETELHIWKEIHKGTESKVSKKINK